MKSLAQEVAAVMGGLFPKGANLHEPSFKGHEWDYVKECLDTGWVSSVGKFVDRFEADLAAYTGVKRAVVVANGTAALQICLKLAGVEAKDEVLMPALTFVATANAAAYLGAVPHFVDCDEASMGLDPVKLEDYLKSIGKIQAGALINTRTGRKIKALMPMHTFGHPVDLDPLVEICNRYHLTLIEDAAESLGSFYKGRHTGNWGKVSALSFNGNKIVTTGGGGAILTNDEALGKLAKHLTTTAKVPHRWDFFHDQLGYNYRMPNLNAALGCAQLEQLPRFIEKKRALHDRYVKAFSALKGLKVFSELSYGKSNYWLNALVLEKESAFERDAILAHCHERSIMARPAWILMNELPMYKDCPKMDLSESVSLLSRIVSIPSSEFL